MSNDQIAAALTSATVGPALGACAVLVAWLLSAIKDGVAIKFQVEHAARQLRHVVVPGLAAMGVLLLASEPWQLAVAGGISAALTAAGFRAPR